MIGNKMQCLFKYCWSHLYFRTKQWTFFYIRFISSESFNKFMSFSFVAKFQYFFLILLQAEINYLGLLDHPNLVNLIGYCLEDDHRMLVYEFMPRGSLENHLFRSKWLSSCHCKLLQNPLNSKTLITKPWGGNFYPFTFEWADLGYVYF